MAPWTRFSLHSPDDAAILSGLYSDLVGPIVLAGEPLSYRVGPRQERVALPPLPHRVAQRRRRYTKLRRRNAKSEVVGDRDARGQIGQVIAACS